MEDGQSALPLRHQLGLSLRHQLALSLRHRLPFSSCYVCRSCTSIVGWPDHLVSNSLSIIPDCLFLTNVQTGNVFVDLRAFERGMYHMFTLYCGVCSAHLGWKIDQSAGPLSGFFPEGTFILFPRCVYFWNGADLLDPVWRPLYG